MPFSHVTQHLFHFITNASAEEMLKCRAQAHLMSRHCHQLEQSCVVYPTYKTNIA